MIEVQLALRQAFIKDQSAIANLIYFEAHVHRHLDWRGPLEWLGAPEYWVLENKGIVSAALACPPDPEGVAWLRLFAHASNVPLSASWQVLWQKAKDTLDGSGLIAASITTSGWFRDLLVDSGFTSEQEIVLLEHRARAMELRPLPSGLILRDMHEDDLPSVISVDWDGFDRLWRNSAPALHAGLLQAGFATVAVVDNEIVGYQISTRNSFGAHLARLAVTKKMQGHGIGYHLVQDLLNKCRMMGLYRITVNTQSNNHKSLALYHRIGFETTGDSYAVFTYPFQL